MNVFVAGGAGYIGHELVTRLAADKRISRVVVFDNLSRRNYSLFIDKRIASSKLEFINGNILHAKHLFNALYGVDVVIHLAGVVENSRSLENPCIFEQVNHWGTAELAHLATSCDVKKFIYLSSDTVYGHSDHPVNNLATPNPYSLYGISKLKGEKPVQLISEKVQTWILRCSAIYGYSPGARFESAINKMLFEAYFLGRMQVKGNLHQKRSFIHVKKVASILHNLLFDSNVRPFETYDVTDRDYSLHDIIEAVREINPNSGIQVMGENKLPLNRIILKDKRIQHLDTTNGCSLQDELMELIEHFSFTSSMMNQPETV